MKVIDHIREADEMFDRFEVKSDGHTVWVNGLDGLLGRFSKLGIDVHKDGKCALDGCSAGPCTIKDWRKFKAKMLKIHGVKVSDFHRPMYLDPLTCIL